jgi:uncharacterized protein
VLAIRFFIVAVLLFAARCFSSSARPVEIMPATSRDSYTGASYMPITALYAGLLVPLFVLLSIQVIQKRRSARVALGDGGDDELLRRMRVQANFAEYVPLALLLMALAESLKTDVWILHGLGIALVVGRIVHAYGVSQSKESFSLRIAGVALTSTILLVAAVSCILGSLQRSAGL